MRKTRRLHLWIGLITSLFIIMEAVTGLFMSEPWLLGMQPPGERTVQQSEPLKEQGEGQNSAASDVRKKVPKEDDGFGWMGVVKALHTGRIGSVNAKVIIDLTAVSLILLSGTGIVLSIRELKAQRKSRKR